MTAIALALALAQDADEVEAVKVCDAYFAAVKKGEYEAAADCMHPKSLAKMREYVVRGLKAQPDRDGIAAKLGFDGWKDLEASSHRQFFVRFCRNIKNLGPEGAAMAQMISQGDAKILGAMKREEKVYVVVELKITMAGEEHVVPALHVLYRDGSRWKLANRNETNIGK